LDLYKEEKIDRVKREKDNLMDADKWLWFNKHIRFGHIRFGFILFFIPNV
jgi:hypothetical protein